MPQATAQFALGRFAERGGVPFVGVVVNETVIVLSDLAPDQFAADVTMADLLGDWDSSLTATKGALAAGPRNGRWRSVSELNALAPVPHCRQLFCTGANYGSHLTQMVVAVGGNAEIDAMNPEERRRAAVDILAKQKAESSPYIFMKPVSSISGPNDKLVLPYYSEMADWEIELGAVIGKTAYRVSRVEALKNVAGYIIANDLTARDKVRRTDVGALGPDWIASKGAPGFTPTGPYLVPSEFVPNPQNLAMKLTVNGEVMQQDNTSDMTFDIARQIEFISSYATMLPGDIICTGTPGGNGVTRGIFLKNGDVMEAEIEGLGRQITRCVAGPAE